MNFRIVEQNSDAKKNSNKLGLPIWSLHRRTSLVGPSCSLHQKKSSSGITILRSLIPLMGNTVLAQEPQILFISIILIKPIILKMFRTLLWIWLLEIWIRTNSAKRMSNQIKTTNSKEIFKKILEIQCKWLNFIKNLVFIFQWFLFLFFKLSNLSQFFRKNKTLESRSKSKKRKFIFKRYILYLWNDIILHFFWIEISSLSLARE